ncbi:MAG: YitT family protein [Ruminococcaceae bacterium]|nr:YitT family protein [Oscillospiraceae bacterium]
MKKVLTKDNVKSIIMFVFGITLTALAISQFTLPNKIVGGGVSGISTILFHVLKIEPGLSTAVINAVLLLVGLKVLGKRFVIATITGVGLLSVLVQLFSYLPPITTNIILASVFGGVFYGVGIGFALAAGGSSGGTDILGRILQHFLPHFPIGSLIMLVDGVVIALSYVFFRNLELTLFGVVTLAVSTYAIDAVIRKLNVSKLAFIVSEKGEEIAKKLVTTSPRGCTIIDTIGAYTHENNKMLVCALKDNELPAFQRKILEIDPHAFIIFSESSQIVGNGFHVYR